MNSPSDRPPCRCKERRQAMFRAAAALAKGDTATWKKESDFIRTTVVEDYKLYREWRSDKSLPPDGVATPQPPTMEELEQLKQQTLARILPPGVTIKKVAAE